MSNLTFFSNNLTLQDGASYSLTTGTENAQYPLSNISLAATTKKFRSTDNTVTIVIDLGSNQTVDTLGIVGDALTGFKFTAMTVRRSATLDFSGSPVISPSFNAVHNFGYSFVTPVSARYWELSFTGNGSYVEFSNIFIGERVELITNAFDATSFKYKIMDRSKVQYNNYGTAFINEYNRQRTLNGSIKLMNKEETKTIRDLSVLHGRHLPIWVMVDQSNFLDDEGEFLYSGYFYFNEGFEHFQLSNHRYFDIDLGFREII